MATKRSKSRSSVQRTKATRNMKPQTQRKAPRVPLPISSPTMPGVPALPDPNPDVVKIG